MRGEAGYRLRLRLAARDGARCFYCQAPFENLAAATLDHYVPYRLWRTHTSANLVLACRPCNHAKGCALPWPLAWLLLAHIPAASVKTAA
ncbi:HNH endonuclease [Nonomuraea sp. NPDC049646]|uniref:HNH endonuclease n=1 Tax=unclassified Nonomuraea TaxID=2593643 RepID=UPI0037BA0926